MLNFFRKGLKPLAMISIATMVIKSKQDYLHSLGIMGFIGKEPKAIKVILDGLEKIPNNDYDASGVATIHGQEARLTKYANSPEIDSLQRLRKEQSTHEGSFVGIGHTHISKTGQRIDSKAHPQCDHNNRIYIVHNGSITNTIELLEFVETKGVQRRSETTTELLAILIGIFVEDGHPLKIATRLALEKTAGTYGIVAVDKLNPDQLVVAQHGSPLFIGVGEAGLTVTSDVNILTDPKTIKVEDGFVYSLDSKAKKIESYKIKDLETLISLGDYAHWTLKEIEEQPQAIARSLNYGARLTSDGAKLKGLEEMKEVFLKVKNLILLGCGSSFHACQYGSHIMKSLNLMDTVISVDATSPFNVPYIDPGAILISESGETQEIIDAAHQCKNEKVNCISVVNAVNSTLANLVGHGVYMNAGQEMSEAPTKSFINSCVVLTEIALWLSHFETPENIEFRKKLIGSLLVLPMMSGSVIARNKADTKSLAHDLKNEEHMFVLGRGMGESIAYEGASLIKQMAKVHAEGYAGGALKHGPFALIAEGTPIILIILDDEHKEMMNLALAEVQARHAKTIVITPNKDLIRTKEPPFKVLLIDENGPLTGLLAIIPIQLLAYYLSIQREIDPDHPSSSEVFIAKGS